MATHSSILARKIPWTEETGGLYSPWGRIRTRLRNLTTIATIIILPSSLYHHHLQFVGLLIYAKACTRHLKMHV